MAKVNIAKILEDINFRDDLKKVVHNIEESNFVSSNIYKYKDNFYFIVSNFIEEKNAYGDDFYIRSYFWAESDFAARRAFSDDIENFSKSSNDLNKILISNLSDFRYSEILKWIKKSLKISFTESASYRISDGAFVHKKIETKMHTFYFLNRDVSDEERPYAILFKLIWKNHISSNN